MLTVSIIIPVYNVEEFLRQCLDTVYAQAAIEDMEVILVNDGSTDKSPRICEEYAEKHPNTRIINKANGGLSDARNVGTEAAKGKYIYYLDSDDWLVSDGIKPLYDFATVNDCEVVQGGFYYAYDDHLLYDRRHKKPFVLDQHDAMLQLIQNDYVKNFAWGKLYRADIVKRHKFPKGKYYEDAYWQHLVMHDISCYGIVPAPLYYYRQRASGISGAFSLKNLDLLRGYEERLKFVQMHYPEYVFDMAITYKHVLDQYCVAAQQTGNEVVRKGFLEYRMSVERHYAHLFSAACRKSIAFRLSQTMPQVYNMVKRIASRLLPSAYRKGHVYMS